MAGIIRGQTGLAPLFLRKEWGQSHLSPNYLGSASAVTNANGSSLNENLDCYPYGGIAPTSTDSVPQNYKFTDGTQNRASMSLVPDTMPAALEGS
jgi:hypothetical protein